MKQRINEEGSSEEEEEEDYVPIRTGGFRLLYIVVYFLQKVKSL